MLGSREGYPMPWRRTGVLEERIKFIAAYLEGTDSVAALCRRFGISRETAHKFLSRYTAEGLDGLRDRSRAPHSHPNAVTEAVLELLVQARRAHPSWGPRKLVAYLARQYPGLVLPAASTVSRVLRRAGLADRRRARRHAFPLSAPFRGTQHPNDLWCADFKGWFRARNGERCEPLTITDAVSRYGLACQVVDQIALGHVRPVFERTFRAYGLPHAVRTDNGPPFASTGLAGLTRLSAWWVALGIRPERITPGRPQQNGRHERFHRTLQDTLPPAATRADQQGALDAFLREYNRERPHAALGNRTPGDLYVPSPRLYPEQLRPLEYAADCVVRTVHGHGDIRWAGDRIFVSEALRGHRLGLRHLTDRHWTVYFGCLEVGYLDERQWRLVPHQTPIWHTPAASAD
jgi:transposase InsO family protein